MDICLHLCMYYLFLCRWSTIFTLLISTFQLQAHWSGLARQFMDLHEGGEVWRNWHGRHLRCKSFNIIYMHLTKVISMVGFLRVEPNYTRQTHPKQTLRNWVKTNLFVVCNATHTVLYLYSELRAVLLSRSIPKVQVTENGTTERKQTLLIYLFYIPYG